MGSMLNRECIVCRGCKASTHAKPKRICALGVWVFSPGPAGSKVLNVRCA